MAADRRRIQSTSFFGAMMSSPAAPAGASSKMPVPSSPSALADAEQLVLGGVGARHRLAVDGQVGDGPRRREPEGAGGDGLLDHLPSWPRCPRRWPVRCGRRARPSRRSAPRRGRSGSRRRRSTCRRSSASRYSGKVSHSHCMPSASARAGDVLDALHQPDQPVVAIGSGRGEADAAVAGDHGGDPVPAARGQHLVPGGLAVVVGVDVHPARRDQQPSASTVRLPLASPAKEPTPLMCPPSTVTSAVRAGAPVPSTTVPPRIRRSCMVASPLLAASDAGTDRPSPQ